MQLDGATKIYGIMGKPVARSLSPAMHNAAFQGVAQFELWTGRKAPVDVMREILFTRLQNK